MQLKVKVKKPKSNLYVKIALFYMVLFLFIPVKACKQSHIVMNAKELPPNINAKEGSVYIISNKQARQIMNKSVCKG